MFSQRPLVFSSDAAKINYVIGLLRGKALAWEQASSLRMYLNTLGIDTFVKWFECIFNRSNYSGSASDHLFTIQQGSRLVTEYATELGTLAEEAA